jgi:hypothetical protein
MTRLFRVAAIVLFAIITFATLSPIQMRPHLGDANMERALAYVLFGLALGLGFSNRLLQTVIFVIGVAAGLELLQAIDPGRDARIADASIKALAGIIGVVVVHLAIRSVTAWMRRRAPVPAE